MNIVCISASQVPSEAANSIQVMKACQALAQLGHRVRLLVPEAARKKQPEHPSIQQLAAFYGLQTTFPVEWLPAERYLKKYDFSLAATNLARSYSADLVYAWPIQAAVFATRHQVPVLLEMHGPPEGRFGPLLFSLLLWLPTRKRILPITGALAKMLGEYSLDWRNALSQQPEGSLSSIPINGNLSFIVAPNGVDLERFHGLPEPTQARLEIGLPEGFTAGYTGHLYPGRGMSLLVELARRFPQVNFLWVGGKPEDVNSWRLKLQAENLMNVTLTGFVENNRLPLYQAAADVLLMPYERVIAGSSGGDSASYASPMKMFEYMASRRPILSSDLPVIREVLNTHNAFLLPPDEAALWFTTLQTCLDEPAQAMQLTEQAWTDVQQFTWLERARRVLEGF
jgi:glycosyltransferase involved in cell wall biosynthesis